jgi:hypothetical protein
MGAFSEENTDSVDAPPFTEAETTRAGVRDALTAASKPRRRTDVCIEKRWHTHKAG